MKFKAMFDPESGSHVELDRPQRPPLTGGQFRAVCALIAAALFVALVLGVCALCGLPGLIVISLAALFIAALLSIGM